MSVHSGDILRHYGEGNQPLTNHRRHRYKIQEIIYTSSTPKIPPTSFWVPGETFVREITVNRKLRSITTSCGDGITVKLENNGSVWMWAYGAAGHEKFPKGITFGTLKNYRNKFQ